MDIRLIKTIRECQGMDKNEGIGEMEGVITQTGYHDPLNYPGLQFDPLAPFDQLLFLGEGQIFV